MLKKRSSWTQKKWCWGAKGTSKPCAHRCSKSARCLALEDQVGSRA